jgi:hypothetical protein
VLGGLAIVVFGLITATGARIWVENRVDFTKARNLVTAAATLTIGAGDLALRIGGFTLGGIGTATFGAIVLYQLWRESGEKKRRWISIPRRRAMADLFWRQSSMEVATSRLLWRDAERPLGPCHLCEISGGGQVWIQWLPVSYMHRT